MTHDPRQATADEVLRLQEIIDQLPPHTDKSDERREYSLTKGDVVLIYRIAKIANVPHLCPFEGEEGEVLHTVAKSVNKTQKIAFRVFVTAVITGIIAGVWYMGVHFIQEFVRNGGAIKP